MQIDMQALHSDQLIKTSCVRLLPWRVCRLLLCAITDEPGLMYQISGSASGHDVGSIPQDSMPAQETSVAEVDSKDTGTSGEGQQNAFSQNGVT